MVKNADLLSAPNLTGLGLLLCATLVRPRAEKERDGKMNGGGHLKPPLGE